jgi:hypothetical protein
MLSTTSDPVTSSRNETSFAGGLFVNNKNIFQRSLIILCLFFVLHGCASVPPEVVQLSALTGRDLVEVHSSYQTLIHEFYDQLRARRIDYLENTWTPAYIKDWVGEGRLRDVAAGKVVWDDNVLDASGKAGDFVPSSSVDDKEARMLDTILGWADAAVYDIENKRKELLKPLDKEEKNLRKEIDKAFANLIRANAATTAYLNSLVKVQAAQDQLLESFDLKETRDNINAALIKASDTAAEGLDKIKEVDEKLGEL